MGVRLYAPQLGRFLSVDPIDGGNASAYDYCNADPINCTDLDGRFGWKSMFKAVAQVAEVASWVPGPVGAAAAAVSAVSYAASGNRAKALEMSLTAAAALVGAAAAVRVGFKATKIAAKVGQRVATAARRTERVAAKVCPSNSFTADTPVLMEDRSWRPISEVSPGDRVLAMDPQTGKSTGATVVGTVIGQGDRHLIELTWTDGQGETTSALTTAGHPVWVESKGWVEAKDLSVRDEAIGATGGLRRCVRCMTWVGSPPRPSTTSTSLVSTPTLSAATMVSWSTTQRVGLGMQFRSA